MGRETLEAVVQWQRVLGDDAAGDAADADHPGGSANQPGGSSGSLSVTFHGGEPLVARARWYREALPLLRDGLAPRRVRFAVQSNLWLLDDELCALFVEHGVSLGTSLDGPEAINDAQRGGGYFAKTMASIERARRYGLDVGAICTFTSQTVSRAEEIFDFFVGEGINFSVHSALPSLRYRDADEWSLSGEAHGELLNGLLDRYLDSLSRVRISTLDSMARSVSAGRGGICTFTDCLGEYLAVGPDGRIYPCQRFAGMAEYAVGRVEDAPSLPELQASPVWAAFAARQEQVKQACGDCAFWALCKGGCPYNAVVAGGGTLTPTSKDPHCEAYRRVFQAVSDRAMASLGWCPGPGGLPGPAAPPGRLVFWLPTPVWLSCKWVPPGGVPRDGGDAR